MPVRCALWRDTGHKGLMPGVTHAWRWALARAYASNDKLPVTKDFRRYMVDMGATCAAVSSTTLQHLDFYAGAAGAAILRYGAKADVRAVPRGVLKHYFASAKFSQDRCSVSFNEVI
eukprot:COSAG02_NODE_6207_length_3727_cov_2.809261_1_plen_117_part_00